MSQYVSYESFFKPRINIASIFSTDPQKPALLDPFKSYEDVAIQLVAPIWIISSIIIQTIKCIFTDFFHLLVALILHLRGNHSLANKHLLRCVSDTGIILIKLPFVTTCDSILASIAIVSRIIATIIFYTRNKLLVALYGQANEVEQKKTNHEHL